MTETVGLSLGGGGARGLAHIIVLEAIDELGLKVGAIAGSSIGALIGMGYAAGLSGRELRTSTLETFADRGKVIGQLWSLRPSNLSDWFSPRSYSLGQIDPEKVLKLFTPIETFPELIEDLDIPLTIIATDYYAWHEVVITEGNLSQSVGASIAIPMIFKPVDVNGRIMIDGNITNPLPFQYVRDDFDKVIAVDVVGGPVGNGHEMPSGFETMLGANQIMMQAITRHKLGLYEAPDVLIRPPINDFGVMDFLKASTIIRVAEAAKDDVKHQIDAMLTKEPVEG